MDKWARLSADQRENLVAYLDGELEDDQTQQIDKVLVQSEVARHEVEALARTWELLDLLPKPSARDDFTERTLTTLKVSETRTRLVDQPWFGYVRKGSIGAMWAAGLALCAILGYTATTQLVTTPQEELLTHLPLTKNLDIYLEVRDLDFVLNLQRAAVFNAGDADDDQPSARRLDIPKAALVTHAVLQERYNEVSRLPAGERQRIQYNWTTWQSLTRAQQQEIENLHAKLKEQPESVQALLNTYAWWLQTLTPGQRDDLRLAENSARRLQLVREYKDKQDANRDTQLFDLNLDPQRWRPRMPPGLNKDDLAAVMDVLQSELPSTQKFTVQNLKGIERYVAILPHFFAWDRPANLSDELLDRIVDAISDGELKSRMPTPADQKRRMMFWLVSGSVRAQVNAELEPFFPTKERLTEFFAKDLTSEQREKLMEMPPQELTRELLKEYFEKEEVNNKELRTLRGFAAKLRPPEQFGGMGRPPGGFNNYGRGRPPGDDRGQRGNGPGPGDGRGPPREGQLPQPPPQPERKVEAQF